MPFGLITKLVTNQNKFQPKRWYVSQWCN